MSDPSNPFPDPQPLPMSVVQMTPEQLNPSGPKKPGPVTLADREGVFAHSFKCSVCDLEFILFSWQANRHGVGRTCCPECGYVTPMLHWRTQLSDRVDFAADGSAVEIYQLCPLGQAQLLDDSRPPGPDRYDGGTMGRTLD